MDSATSPTSSKTPNGANCPPVPEFRRLNYVYGQLLGVADFQAEQSYFREKQRLHNRCLHGYGVVCGLLVGPVDVAPDCQPKNATDARDLERLLKTLEQQRQALHDAGKPTTDIDAQIEAVRKKLAWIAPAAPG